MDNFYIFVVALLFLLAISDLVVGVSNDAVNFLNSAIGSKVAPFRLIMIIAALGILVGTTFSSGMMEVARKSIFHPESFYFKEIMIIFLAVMLTDIILLDLFNTFGLPTSTTVSIVFELLGAAVAISLIKISNSPEGAQDISGYINSGKALAIIAGILLSVIVAFTIGTLVQYLARIIFSFEYEKTLKYFGSVWGGIAITAITYFILIKGAKGSSFITTESLHWIKSNTLNILVVSFVGWTVLLQVLNWLFKINILKFIVLVGTFALAMAFAGNDLVNFIGVPLAGFESFKAYIASGAGDPGLLTMEVLQGKVQTPTHFLLIAGIIMVATLWLSKKARSVTKTELDLSRQSEGIERFESSYVARAIVRSAISFTSFMQWVFSISVQKRINKRFDRRTYEKIRKEKGISFDLVRASVNLTVASILIAIGTSLKLPLSTTYVTFMVAMGTSLADRAWGRESGVYRITGVVTIIGGWFFTALGAFTFSFLAALFIYWAGLIGIVILLAFAIFFVFKAQSIHKERDKKKKRTEEKFIAVAELKGEGITHSCRDNVSAIIISLSKLYYLVITGLKNEDRKLLKKTIKDIKDLNLQTKDLKNNVYSILKGLDDATMEAGQYYVQVLDYLREAAHCLTYLSEPIFKHIDNNHKPLRTVQKNYLTALNEEISTFFNFILDTVKKDKFDAIDEIVEKQQLILDQLKKLRKKQVKMIRKEEAGTRISLLYFNTLGETKNLVLNTVNILKAQRDFINQVEKKF